MQNLIPTLLPLIGLSMKQHENMVIFYLIYVKSNSHISLTGYSCLPYSYLGF